MVARPFILAKQFIFLVLLLVTACRQTPLPSPTPTVEPVITIMGDTGGYPGGCQPDEVATLVLHFFEAYNAGDQEQLASFFPQTFEWYSDTIEAVNPEESRHFVTRPGNREELLDYFAERHKQREQLQLLALSVSEDARVNIVNIAWAYRRQADDVQSGPDGVTRIGSGKGALQCRSQEIYVWSMGTAAPFEDEDQWLWSCTKPPSAETRSSIICLEYMEET